MLSRISVFRAPANASAWLLQTSKSCTSVYSCSVAVNPFRSNLIYARNFNTQLLSKQQQTESVAIGGEEADEIEIQDVDVSEAKFRDVDSGQLKEKQYDRKVFLKNKSITELKDMLYAVVHIGGKQYKVVKGDLLTVDRIPVDVGTQISLDKVLLVGGKSFTAVGRPLVSDAKVLATVEQQTRTAPVIVFKMKRRKGYRRWNTSQALVSTVRIDDVKYEVDAVQVVREERVVAVE